MDEVHEAHRKRPRVGIETDDKAAAHADTAVLYLVDHVEVPAPLPQFSSRAASRPFQALPSRAFEANQHLPAAAGIEEIEQLVIVGH